MAKRWLIAAVAAPVILVGAACVAALTFDPNTQKDRIVAAVERASGRTLRLGALHVAWGLTPALSAEDVAFPNAPGGSRPDMLTAKRATARLRLLPLLTGQVELASLTFEQPDLLLERVAGRANWQFTRPPVAAPTGPATSSFTPATHRAPPLVDQVVLEGGRLILRNPAPLSSHTIDLTRATLAAGVGPLDLVVEGHEQGRPIRIELKTGSIAALQGATPVPLSMHTTLDTARFSFDGTSDWAGQLVADVPDGSVVAPYSPYLRSVHDLHVAGSLPLARMQEATVTIGASQFGAVSLTRLSLVWHAGQPARLDASGSYDGAPWTIGSGVTILPPAAVQLRGLTAQLGNSDLSGDLAVGRPVGLRGTVISQRLDLDALRAVMPPWRRLPTPLAAPAPPTAGSPPSPAPARLFSDAPIAGLRRPSDPADFDASATTVRLAGQDWHGVSAHLGNAGGVITYGPIRVAAPALTLSATTDTNASPPASTLTLRSGGFPLGVLLPLLGLPGTAQGVAELDVALAASGDSQHALAASLTGHAGLAVVDAELPNAALAAALGDALPQAQLGLDPAGSSHLRCLAVRADAKDGTVTIGTLALDATRLLVDGTGTADLGGETLALHLRPVLRLGGTEVAAPVQVTGPLVHPAVGLDPGVSGRTSVTLGGAAPPDRCPDALLAARDGHPGRLPEAAAAVKPPKPADLLRSLLR